MSVFIPNDRPEEPDPEISNLDFFPAISLAAFRERMKVLSDLPEGRVVWQLKRAVMATNRELHDWRLAQEAEGHLTLTDIPQEEYGDEGKLTLLYEAAVYHRAKGLLTEAGRDVDLTNEGADATDFADEAIEDHFRHVREALAEIISRSSVTAELF